MAYKFISLKRMREEPEIIKITTSKRVSVRKIHQKWTAEGVLAMARTVHGDAYDYTFTKCSGIGKCTKLTIKCNTCTVSFKLSVQNHIYNKLGCRPCTSPKKRWNFERFLEEAEHIHGTTYFYACNDTPIKSSSRIDIKCLVCHHQWQSTVANHIYNKSGYCVICKSHKITSPIEHNDRCPITIPIASNTCICNGDSCVDNEISCVDNEYNCVDNDDNLSHNNGCGDVSSNITSEIEDIEDIDIIN